MSHDPSVRPFPEDATIAPARQHARLPTRIVPSAAPSNADTLIADIWLDAPSAIQRRGHGGTIRQALDDIETAFECVDALEAGAGLPAA